MSDSALRPASVRTLWALLLVMTASPLLPAQDRQALPRHVHAVLEDAMTSQPIAGAEVSVLWSAEGSTQERSTRSDRHGHVDLRDLPAQVVTLRVRALGYAAITRAVDLRGDDLLLKLRMDPVITTLGAFAVLADSMVDPLERVAAVTSLDRAALDAQRGRTLGETIKQLPGVSVIQLGPAIAKPVIRGLNSQRVVVLNGGLRQEDQQWGTEHAPNVDSFEADAVTIVRGAGTVLYGPDALGGVVRVDRAPVPDSGGLRGELVTNAFSNSRQGALSAAVQGGDLRLPGLGRAGYRARVTGRVAGNAAAPDYHLSNTGFRELNGSLTLGVHRDWGYSELSLSHFGTELGVLRQAHAGNFEDLQRAMNEPPPDSAFTYGIDRPNQRVAHSTLRWRTVRELDDNGELELVYGLQYNNRREYDNHGPLRFQDVPAFHLKLFTNSVDVRWHHVPLGGLFGTFGVSGIVQGNQTLGKGFLIPGFDLLQGAAYAQEEWGSGPWSLSGGARVDVVQQTTLAYQDAGIQSPAGTRRWSGFAGSLGAAYRLTEAWEASLRLAQAWRPPTVNERYAQGVHHGTAQYELGDASLRSERSQGVEAGLRYTGTRASLDVSAYRNVIDGFIYLEPRDPVVTIRGTFPAFTYAQTDALMRGVELAGSVALTGWLSLDANATVIRGRDRRREQPLYDMPADRGLVTLRVNGLGDRVGPWELGVGTVLVREQDGVPEGTIYTLPTDGYALLQGNVAWRQLAIGDRAFDVTLSVTNALNARYRDYLSRYRLFVDDAARDVVLRVRTSLW